METKNVLHRHNKTMDDVLWVSIKYDDSDVAYKIDKSLFILKADREYNNGFGLSEVNRYLTLVGEDFWLERHEYDGSEWWEYKSMPVEPEKTTYVVDIFGEY